MGLTVRLRLTLLYSVLFLLSGACLLTISYILVTTSKPIVSMGAVPIQGGERGTTGHEEKPASEPQVAGPEVVDDVRKQLVAKQQQEEIKRQLVVKSVVALAIMAAVSTLLGWLVSGRVLRPLQTMTDSIQRISARNVHERLAVTGPRDELKNLADTVDGLLGRLEAALDSHKRFVVNAAHELRTPLTLERALLQEAVSDPNPTVDSHQAHLEELSLVSEQQTRLLDSLLVLATSERGLNRTENVDLAELTGDVIRAAEPRRQGLRVVLAAAPAPVTGDPALVRRLVANLVDNAMSYNVPDGWVEVATGVDGEHCLLSVTNTGPPVPPEIVDELINPFQRLSRTEDDGHHGLGLSIVKTIAAAHAAEMTVRARPGGGLTIRILFPAGKPAPGPERSPPGGDQRPPS
jgi:signal transduction histidine kinase